MVYRFKIQMGFLLLLISTTILFPSSLKEYMLEKGMVLYSIKGRGILTDELNLSIEGEGKLRFKKWGKEALIEESYTEKTSGSFVNIEKIKHCKKLEDKQRYDVDFKKKKVLERPMPKGNFLEHMTEGLEKTGQEIIASYLCDIWEGRGVKKCIYKGIPLLIEYYALGIYYQKKASSVKFNIKPEASKCTVPDYPLEKISLFKSNMKVKGQTSERELSKILHTVTQQMQEKHLNEDKLTKDQKRFLLNQIGKNIFEKQKVLLPKFLEVLKTSRICLYQAESTSIANKCLKQLIPLKSQITSNKRNSIVSWNEKERNTLLTAFDEKISFLEPKMKCVRGAHNITDLSSCMK